MTARAGWSLGVALAVAVALAAGVAATFAGEVILGFERSPVSDIMMAIIIGMLIANLVALPQGMQSGLRFCASTVLRVGIMLLGIRLSLLGAGRFTLLALPFVLVAIGIGLTTVRFVGQRMGLSRELSGLIAVGTSICGCTAIVATAPLIRAREGRGQLRHRVYHGVRSRRHVRLSLARTLAVRGHAGACRTVPRHVDTRDRAGRRRRPHVRSAIPVARGAEYRDRHQARTAISA
ncbi:MAG: putative sulfate exporter family transporter [Woeseiaceae bacterium]|nr:putative sulfate exporter family transporter [Woeseiaceae bacterium]